MATFLLVAGGRSRTNLKLPTARVVTLSISAFAEWRVSYVIGSTSRQEQSDLAEL